MFTLYFLLFFQCHAREQMRKEASTLNCLWMNVYFIEQQAVNFELFSFAAVFIYIQMLTSKMVIDTSVTDKLDN